VARSGTRHGLRAADTTGTGGDEAHRIGQILKAPITTPTRGRGAAPTHHRGRENTVNGTIKTLRADKGFGFITDASGEDVFFHRTAIYGESIDDLREGDHVEFDLGQPSPKGPRAENVRRTST
jgi:CspA family cold shock protein